MFLRFHIDMPIKTIAYTPTPEARQMPLYIESSGIYYSNERYFTERSGLDSFLLMNTISGKGYLKYSDREFILLPNSCVLVNCSEYHYYRTLENSWTFDFVHFNGISAKQFFSMIGDEPINNINIEIFNKFKKIEQSYEQLLHVRYNEIMINILSSILYQNKNNADQKNPKHSGDIESAMIYIKEHFSDNITIDEICDRVKISKFYFIRLFKLYTAMTPYEYLTGIRINHAKSLLKDTRISLDEIASHCGFNDTSTFIRCFKRITGYTPANYRVLYI